MHCSMSSNEADTLMQRHDHMHELGESDNLRTMDREERAGLFIQLFYWLKANNAGSHTISDESTGEDFLQLDDSV